MKSAYYRSLVILDIIIMKNNCGSHFFLIFKLAIFCESLLLQLLNQLKTPLSLISLNFLLTCFYNFREVLMGSWGAQTKIFNNTTRTNLTLNLKPLSLHPTLYIKPSSSLFTTYVGPTQPTCFLNKYPHSHVSPTPSNCSPLR